MRSTDTDAQESSARIFLDAVQLQMVVIGAVLMREIHTRYGRENLGFIWFVMEPLMFCMGVILIWLGIHGRFEHGLPILTFVMTGYLPLTFWRHVTNRAVQCFRANASLLYHRQVKLMDLLVARVILEFYGTLIAFIIIAFVFHSLGMYELPHDWGLFYLGWLYFLLFTLAIGLIIGALTEMYEWMEKMVGPFMYFMLPVCGAFFMVDWLPYRLQRGATYIPTVDAFEIIRSGQFGPSVVVHYNIAYETFICVAMLALGIVLCRNVHRYLVFE